jgi:hypothetical protein
VQGYVRLGRQLRPADCTALASRIDAVMLGSAGVDYSRLRMSRGGQLPGANQGVTAMGHHAATLDYQKIQGLEHEPLFLRYMRSPLVRHAAAHALGPHASVGVYRAMFFNKPSAELSGGNVLDWHQDLYSTLHPNPVITLCEPRPLNPGCICTTGIHSLKKCVCPRQTWLSMHRPKLQAASQSSPARTGWVG